VPYRSGGGGVARPASGTYSPQQPIAGGSDAIAIVSCKRLVNLAKVPTGAETLKGFEALLWTALFAPPDTPEPVVGKLDPGLAMVTGDRDYQARMKHIGLTVRTDTAVKICALPAADTARWCGAIREAGILADWMEWRYRARCDGSASITPMMKRIMPIPLTSWRRIPADVAAGTFVTALARYESSGDMHKGIAKNLEGGMTSPMAWLNKLRPLLATICDDVLHTRKQAPEGPSHQSVPPCVHRMSCFPAADLASHRHGAESGQGGAQVLQGPPVAPAGHGQFRADQDQAS